MRIHGLVHLIIGAAVAFISYRLNPEKLVFFIWAGIGLAIWGLLKFVFKLFTGKKERTIHQQISKRHTHNPKQSLAVRYCHNCGTAVHVLSNFCHKCGQRLLHRR
jgi:uncharacterized paraquat-inducible protein A